MTQPAKINVQNVAINFARENFLEDQSVSQSLLDNGRNRVRLLGTDLYMFGTGDLLFEERIREFERVDLGRVAGVYDYAQAITHRLMTSRGTLPEDRFFGVPWNSYIGRSYISSSAVRTNLVQDITDELYRDRRTQEVVYVRVDFKSPTVVAVECAVIPVGTSTEEIQIAMTVGEAT